MSVFALAQSLQDAKTCCFVHPGLAADTAASACEKQTGDHGTDGAALCSNVTT